jgi:uncharacterized protein YjbI with pentapeptide repeats
VIGAVVIGAAVIGAEVSGAAVIGAEVSGAAVIGAEVSGVAVIGAEVTGAVVAGAMVVGAEVKGAIVDRTTGATLGASETKEASSRRRDAYQNESELGCWPLSRQHSLSTRTNRA